MAFDFNHSGEPEHIGMVEKMLSASLIQTIEGNTSDHVYRRRRARSRLQRIGVPAASFTRSARILSFSSDGEPVAAV